MPELSVDPGYPGDEAVGLDGAKNGPGVGIDLMDLPLPILPDPERPFSPRSPESRRRQAQDGSEHLAVLGSIFWMRSSAI